MLPISLENCSFDKTLKLNTTTRLIDEQLKRIKSKINQSESNNQMLQQRKFEFNKDEENIDILFNNNNSPSKRERQIKEQ